MRMGIKMGKTERDRNERERCERKESGWVLRWGRRRETEMKERDVGERNEDGY